MTNEQMQERIAQLEQELAKQKAASVKAISFKVGEKGGISAYGLGRFPVTLYWGQWERLIAKIPALVEFAKENSAKLAVKE